jgi:alpha-tubulin suppressor-like RCC1 family protein
MKVLHKAGRRVLIGRASVFLIAVALIGGVLGCGGQPASSYDLAITSTSGGMVTSPGEGTFAYDPGTSVGLVAEAEEGYRFVNWIGDVATIADVEAAATTVTMNGNYAITAVFAKVYSLTLSSTVGGAVTVPGEGMFSYDGGTVVDLVAEAEEAYRFVNWSGEVDTVGDVQAAITAITMNGNCAITAHFEYVPMVAGGVAHTVGLRSDGTVVAVGYNDYGQCDVGGWIGIIRVDGFWHTVGLKADGTVVAVGYNDYGQCDVGDWTAIVRVAAGYRHTVGLKSDGTAVAVGDNNYGQCNVGGWMGIIQVDGFWHTVGLKFDGTVVAVGLNDYGQCEVGGWAGIVRVAGGYGHTVGVKSDGTVVAVGYNYYGQCEVGGWTGVVQVAAGDYHTVGLKSDGTVVAVGDNEMGQCDVGSWTGIVGIAAGSEHTVGLKSDGTVVSTGRNNYGQCDVGGWDLVP